MRVLYVAPHLAVPPIGGPELRTWNSIRALAQAKGVSVAVMPSRGVDSSTRVAVNELGAKITEAPHRAPRTRILRRPESLADSVTREAKKQKIDVIWWSYAPLHARAIQEVRLRMPRIGIVADTDSVWSRFVGRGVIAATNDKHRDDILREAHKAEVAEESLMRYADTVTAVSEVDAEYFRLIPGIANVHVFANVVHLADFDEELPFPALRDSAISVSGSFYAEHSPMVHGTRWLLRDVMPSVWSLNPDVAVRVVGRGSNKYFVSEDYRVEVLGQVSNIRREIARTHVAVAPLFFESGTRFKILEAAALGIPVVSTSLGAEGLRMEHLSEIFVADSATEFATQIIALIENPEHARQIAANARRVVRSEYSLEIAARQAEEVLSAFV